MRLYTLGYQGLTMEAIVEKAVELEAVVIDTRLRAASRAPQWNKNKFVEAFAREPAIEPGVNEPGYIYAAYRHFSDFGNLNYRNPSAGIRIANPEVGVNRMRALVEEGWENFILMCVCPDWATCHRTTVAGIVMGMVINRDFVNEPIFREEVTHLTKARDFPQLEVARTTTTRRTREPSAQMDVMDGLIMPKPRLRFD